ncbi:hypothetical protein EDB83DRAFT_2319685 [Lactarius deliciosus]|nr:hypothetical protein EDB83DRAFT_2319685 [Lactarius deliciosus]
MAASGLAMGSRSSLILTTSRSPVLFTPSVIHIELVDGLHSASFSTTNLFYCYKLWQYTDIGVFPGKGTFNSDMARYHTRKGKTHQHAAMCWAKLQASSTRLFLLSYSLPNRKDYRNVMPSRIDRRPTGVDRSCCIPRQKLFGLLEDMQKSQEQFFVGNFSWCTVTSITVLHSDSTAYITASATTKLKVRTMWTWGDWILS